MFDELVEVDAEKFKNKAEMLSVNKSILQTQDVVVIVFVQLSV